MISLADIKEKICEERDIKEKPLMSFKSATDSFEEKESPFDLVKTYITKHPKKALTVLENIAESEGKDLFPAGETFHSYFSDSDLFAMLKDMRDDDPEKFYTIIRLEELYLNTILRLTNKTDAIIHFNIDDMFS